MKHNKKRNTAFLYKSLIKELTRAALNSDIESKNIITSILKEHFSADSILYKELILYRTLCETNNVNNDIAEKILVEVKRIYHSFDDDEIFNEQSKVIKKVNNDLSKRIFSNFISNYKTLATISQMFDNRTPIKKRIIFEQSLINLMTSKSEIHPVMKPIDNITYNLFIQKFNEKYDSSLNENQKMLLSRYVTLSPETAVEFKLFINDEINRLKEAIKEMQDKKEVLLDEDLSLKNKKIFGILESFKEQKIDDFMIKQILKIQALAAEV